MFARLTAVTHALQAPYYQDLFAAFWRDEQFVASFKKAPAAKKMHHARIGGLLEHTLSMAVLAEKIADHYGGVDRDLLLAGVILHDIGKIREFQYDTCIDYSDAGRLIGHIVIGIEMLNDKLGQLPHFPPEAALQLKHLILSHHGALEFGSPELPKTVEAILLNSIDEIDSRVNGIRDLVESSGANGQWSAYHRLWSRHFFINDAALGRSTPVNGQ
jgi:3'-5' exoribonuclease